MARKRPRSTGSVSRATTRPPKPSPQAWSAVTAGGDAVVSLRKSLEILRAFQPGDGPLSRHEIAQRTGLPNTTVTRLIYTLLTLGYLSRVGAHSSYRPGPSVLAIGHALIEALPIRRIARPLMQAFAAKFDVWTTLGAAEGDKMLVLEHVASQLAPDVRVRPGSLLSISNTALGRASLWAQIPKRRADYLAKSGPGKWSSGPHLRDDIEGAFAELDSSRFYAAFGSWQHDTLGTGTPIPRYDDRNLLVLTCGNLNQVANAHALTEKCGPALLRLASDIKSQLLQSGSLEEL